MRERVARIVGKKRVQGITLTTFHSFCMQVLRKEITRLGYSSSFSLYDENDIRRVIRTIAEDTEVEVDEIFSAKSRGVSPDSFKSTEGTEMVYAGLKDAMRAYNAVDFDSLLSLTLELLRSHPEVKDALSKQYRYIMVDEYQDTNQIQDQIAHLLSSHHNNLCVVGDDDQSIYSWRGADVANILHFKYDTLIRLEQNYRSKPPILRAANALIANNKSRHGKELFSSQSGGQPIELFHTQTEEEEVEAIVKRAVKIKTDENLAWGDFAILYRSNRLARLFEKALLAALWPFHGEFRRGIPYTIFGGMELYERSEIKDLIAYLKAIANPADKEALLRIINTPRRGISERTLIKLHETSDKLWPLLVDIKNGKHPDLLSERASGAVSSFVILMQNARQQFQSSLTGGLRWLLDAIHYKSYVDEDKWDNVEHCMGALSAYVEQTEDPTLVDFVSSTLLDKEKLEEKKSDLERGKLNLMTFHSSKGLEFPVVFLACLEDHIVPHEKGVLETGLEEERRLFYVALTRAKERLFLSMSRKRRQRGKESATQPSRFLFEIPKDQLFLAQP